MTIERGKVRKGRRFLSRGDEVIFRDFMKEDTHLVREDRWGPCCQFPVYSTETVLHWTSHKREDGRTGYIQTKKEGFVSLKDE